MPNYKYKCTECDEVTMLMLKISSDATKLLLCKKCHKYTMERRIGGGHISRVQRNTLGDWYKQQTGKELLGE